MGAGEAAARITASLLVILVAVSVALPASSRLLPWDPGYSQAVLARIRVGFTPVNVEVNGNRLAVAGERDVIIYDSTGMLIRHIRLSSELIDMEARAGTLYIVSTKQLIIVDLTSGETELEKTLPLTRKYDVQSQGFSYMFTAALRPGTLYVTDSSGREGVYDLAAYPSTLKLIDTGSAKYMLSGTRGGAGIISVVTRSSRIDLGIYKHVYVPPPQYVKEITGDGLDTMLMIAKQRHVLKTFFIEKQDGDIETRPGVSFHDKEPGPVYVMASTNVENAEGTFLVLASRRALDLVPGDQEMGMMPLERYPLLRGTSSMPVYVATYNGMVFAAYPHEMYLIKPVFQMGCIYSSFIVWSMRTGRSVMIADADVDPGVGRLAVAYTNGYVFLFNMHRLDYKPYPVITIESVDKGRHPELEPRCMPWRDGMALFIYNETSLVLTSENSGDPGGDPVTVEWEAIYRLGDGSVVRTDYSTSKEFTVEYKEEIYEPVYVDLYLYVTDGVYNNTAHVNIVILPYIELEDIVSKAAHALATIAANEINLYRCLLRSALTRIDMEEKIENVLGIASNSLIGMIIGYLTTAVTVSILNTIASMDPDNQVSPEDQEEIAQHINEMKQMIQEIAQRDPHYWEIINGEYVKQALENNYGEDAIKALYVNTAKKLLENLGGLADGVKESLAKIIALDRKIAHILNKYDIPDKLDFALNVADKISKIAEKLEQAGRKLKISPIDKFSDALGKSPLDIIIEAALSEGLGLEEEAAEKMAGKIVGVIDIIIKTYETYQLVRKITSVDYTGARYISYYVNMTVIRYIANISRGSELFRRAVVNTTTVLRGGNYVLVNVVRVPGGEGADVKLRTYINASAIAKAIMSMFSSSQSLRAREAKFFVKYIYPSIVFLATQYPQWMSCEDIMRIDELDIEKGVGLGFSLPFIQYTAKHLLRSVRNSYTFLLKQETVKKIRDIILAVASILTGGIAGAVIVAVALVLTVIDYFTDMEGRITAMQMRLYHISEKLLSTMLVDRVSFLYNSVKNILSYFGDQESFNTIESAAEELNTGSISPDMRLGQSPQGVLKDLVLVNATIYSPDPSYTPGYLEIGSEIYSRRADTIIPLGFSAPAKYWYEAIPRYGIYPVYMFSLVTGLKKIVVDVRVGLTGYIDLKEKGWLEKIRDFAFNIFTKYANALLSGFTLLIYGETYEAAWQYVEIKWQAKDEGLPSWAKPAITVVKYVHHQIPLWGDYYIYGIDKVDYMEYQDKSVITGDDTGEAKLFFIAFGPWGAIARSLVLGVLVPHHHNPYSNYGIIVVDYKILSG